MTTEDTLGEWEAETSLHEEEQTEAFNNVLFEQVQDDNFSKWVQQAHCELFGWVDDGKYQLNDHVEWHHDEEEWLEIQFSKNRVILLVSEEEC